MMEDLFSQLAVSFDLPILDWIAANLTSPALDWLMPRITALGNAGIFWILVAVVLLLLPKHRRAGAAMGAALLAGLLICNVLLKPLCARIRPFDFQLLYFGKTIPLLISAPGDFSFPSGHTIASFEAATVLLLYRCKWGIPAIALAAVIAFSRLYLYVHYPSDVLFAMAAGIGIGFGAWHLTRHIWPDRK